MTNSNQNDNRKAPRISINRSAVIKIADEERKTKLLDISLCGSGILCNEPIPVGPEVTLIFSLPNHDSDAKLAISGHVVRSAAVQNQHLVGIEFDPLDLHQDLVIKGFFTYHDRLNK